MCGIFGAIGNRINPGIIRALAIVNRERGTDSLGLFSNSGKCIKMAKDPLECLAISCFTKFIDGACSKGWFIAGHTRYATRGAVITKNAHPFRYGRIIGCHNGIVRLPKDSKYAVDSQILFDRLNQHKGNYQSAFSDLEGYWALAWFDGESFYLQSHDNEVYIGRDKKGVWYYSSEYVHLLACAGKLDCMDCLFNGRTIRFNIKCREFEDCPSYIPAGYSECADSFKEESDPFYVADDYKWDGDHWSRVADYEDWHNEYYR
jgi:glutamine phosphoribosylpyrophosphate amidotransferase